MLLTSVWSCASWSPAPSKSRMSCAPAPCATSSIPMPPDPPSGQTLPGFHALAFDLEQCRRDLDAFDALLASSPELGEQQDILPFFRLHPHLSLFLGSYDTNLD